MLSRFCSLVLLTATFSVQAVDTSADEARIDALVAEINEANKATQVPSLYGDEPGTLVADNPAEASAGSESVAVPLDEPAVAEDTAVPTEDAAVADADAVPTAEANPAPASDEIVPGPIKFEQLAKLVGRRIKVMTLSGRRYEGEVTAVTDTEARISVRMYGTGVTVMPIKKAHVSAIELL